MRILKFCFLSTSATIFIVLERTSVSRVFFLSGKVHSTEVIMQSAPLIKTLTRTRKGKSSSRTSQHSTATLCAQRASKCPSKMATFAANSLRYYR